MLWNALGRGDVCEMFRYWIMTPSSSRMTWREFVTYCRRFMARVDLWLCRWHYLGSQLTVTVIRRMCSQDDMLRFKLRTEMVPGTQSYTLVLIYLTHLPLPLASGALLCWGLRRDVVVLTFSRGCLWAATTILCFILASCLVSKAVSFDRGGNATYVT